MKTIKMNEIKKIDLNDDKFHELDSMTIAQLTIAQIVIENREKFTEKSYDAFFDTIVKTNDKRIINIDLMTFIPSDMTQQLIADELIEFENFADFQFVQ